MPQSTVFQVLAACAEITGKLYTLRQSESLLQCKVTESEVTLQIEVLKVTETAREIRQTAREIKLVSWSNVSGQWKFAGQISIPDQNFQIKVIVKWGKVQTPREYLANQAWERDCYRPEGNIESYETTFEKALVGLASPVMMRHWKITPADLFAVSET